MKPALVIASSLVVPLALGLSAGCAEPFFDDDIGVEGVATDVGALAGRFAIKGVAVDQAENALLGKIDTGGISFYLSTRTFNDETQAYDEVLKSCFVENFETAGLQTTNNPDAVAAIPEIRATLSVDHATGAYLRTTFREYWAIQDLADDDELPTDKDSPVYFDSDDDDHPGATVFTQGLVPDGEVYIAQRKTVESHGVVQGPDESFGLLRAAKEGIVLDANNSLLFTEAKRVPHPDPKQSWWMELRLGDDAGCDDVIAAKDAEDLPQRRPF